jgi:two-component system sensor histidine kinase KdpD
MTEPRRPDPDALLAAIHKEQAQEKRGKLKIFLGMAAGVGKTYAMLEAARVQRAEGRDVVVGYVETHGRRETDALAEGLETVPRWPIVHRGLTLTEMDLDALLARHPQLAIVDELAHTNAPGSRHPKRYQDVLELLDAGMDVYTTLNVQHLESRSDTVREITGATIHETVPDSVLEGAEIELVDLSPEDLLKRFDEGKVYVPERAEVARGHFFQPGNLAALREIALRLAAERVGQDVREYMQARQIAGPWKTGHRLLVAVSPSPLSELTVRWTRRLADSLECSWIAAYVETSHVLSDQEQNRLTRHLSLARELGAEVRTTSDDDVVRGLLHIARSQNVTQIVVGRPAGSSWLSFLRGGLLLPRLIRDSGTIDVHVVRAEPTEGQRRPPLWRGPAESEWPQYFTAVGAIAGVTVLNLVLVRCDVHSRTIGLIYLMAVVALAIRLGRGPVYVAAALSALLWNFLFLPPRYTFYINSLENVMMFVTYFAVALVMGHLIARVRARERMDRRREERATAMYLLTLNLADATSWEQIDQISVANVERVFKSEAALLRPDASSRLRADLSDKELSIAQWAFQHAQPTGRFTDTLPMADATYLPLRTDGTVLGVLRVKWRQSSPPTLDQQTLLEGFQRHIALVLDRQRLRDLETQARLLAESERFTNALLSSISHELRTPLAAITSAVSGLADQGPQVQEALIQEIRQASDRLNRLVDNLLDMTRLESGHMKPNLDWCDVGDLIHVTIRHMTKDLAGHPVTVTVVPGLPLVRMDMVLMEQALTNLLLNAAVHTPAGTQIQVGAAVQEAELAITVADRGPGLPAGVLPHVFEKFYRAPGSPAGGTGLGLTIVKGFVEAQGGRVQGVNRAGGGAAFTVTLPVGKEPTV